MLQQFWRERRRSRAIARDGLATRALPSHATELVQRAAATFQAPMAILSVIEGEDYWVKASCGLSARWLPRRTTFCHRTLDRGAILEVCDAAGDPRFADLPTVTGVLGIRYYVGTAVALPGGIDIGALCVVDTRPRPPCSPDQRAYLMALGRQCAALIAGPEVMAA